MDTSGKTKSNQKKKKKAIRKGIQILAIRFFLKELFWFCLFLIFEDFQVYIICHLKQNKIQQCLRRHLLSLQLSFCRNGDFVMGKFHIISYLQKYDNNGPITEAILSPFYMVCFTLSSILNYYYWTQVYYLNLRGYSHIPLAQVSGISPNPVENVGDRH